MAALKVLSVAVASGRAGYVFLQGAQLQDWGITVKAVQQTTELVAFVQGLINELKPDVVVTEDCGPDCKKGASAKKLIRAVAHLASQNYVLDVSVARPRSFPSKHEEATDLLKRHPELAGYLPERKPRFYEFEPRSMILFEALALAESVIYGPPDRLAAAMG